MLHCFFYVANNGVSSHLFPINLMNRLRLWRQWRQVGRQEGGYWQLHARLGSPCLHYNRTIISLSLAFRDEFQLYACWICGFAVPLCRDLPIITSWQAGDGGAGVGWLQNVFLSRISQARLGLAEGPWEQLELLPPRVISICIRSACCNLQQVLHALQ